MTSLISSRPRQETKMVERLINWHRGDLRRCEDCGQWISEDGWIGEEEATCGD